WRAARHLRGGNDRPSPQVRPLRPRRRGGYDPCLDGRAGDRAALLDLQRGGHANRGNARRPLPGRPRGCLPAAAAFMSSFAANGVEIYYEEEGRGEPLLLLPGLAESIDMLRGVRRWLARKYRVIAAELPGSGRSQPQPRP